MRLIKSGLILQLQILGISLCKEVLCVVSGDWRGLVPHDRYEIDRLSPQTVQESLTLGRNMDRRVELSLVFLKQFGSVGLKKKIS